MTKSEQIIEHLMKEHIRSPLGEGRFSGTVKQIEGEVWFWFANGDREKITSLNDAKILTSSRPYSYRQFVHAVYTQTVN
jgi:hypothetical protein